MPVQISVIGAVAAALLTAAIVAFITTPVVRTLAFRVGAVDIPRDSRRMHNHPIPRMGGLAIFFRLWRYATCRGPEQKFWGGRGEHEGRGRSLFQKGLPLPSANVFFNHPA